MKCEDKIGEYCRQAITYKRYAEIRRCDKCCLNCESKCFNNCDKADKAMEELDARKGV